MTPPSFIRAYSRSLALRVFRFSSMDIRCGPHYVLALMDHVTAEPVKVVFQRQGKNVEVTIQPRQRDP